MNKSEAMETIMEKRGGLNWETALENEPDGAMIPIVPGLFYVVASTIPAPAQRVVVGCIAFVLMDKAGNIKSKSEDVYGVAFCSPGDEWDYTVGRKIAVKRALKSARLEFNKMRYPEVVTNIILARPVIKSLTDYMFWQYRRYLRDGEVY